MGEDFVVKEDARREKPIVLFAHSREERDRRACSTYLRIDDDAKAFDIIHCALNPGSYTDIPSLADALADLERNGKKPAGIAISDPSFSASDKDSPYVQKLHTLAMRSEAELRHQAEEGLKHAGFTLSAHTDSKDPVVQSQVQTRLDRVIEGSITGIMDQERVDWERQKESALDSLHRLAPSDYGVNLVREIRAKHPELPITIGNVFIEKAPAYEAAGGAHTFVHDSYVTGNWPQRALNDISGALGIAYQRTR